MSGCCFEKKMTEPFSTVADLSVVLAVVHLCQVRVLTGLHCPGWGSYCQSWAWERCLAWPVLSAMLEIVLVYGGRCSFASMVVLLEHSLKLSHSFWFFWCFFFLNYHALHIWFYRQEKMTNYVSE